MTRRGRGWSRARGAVCALSVACAVALAVAGVVGIAVSDRTLLTQYLSWVPGVVLWPVALGASALAFAAAKRPRLGWRGRLPRASVCVAAGCALTASLGAAREWRAHALVTGAAAPAEESIRIVNWNMTSNGSAIWEKPFAAIGGIGRPDLLLLSTTQPLKRLRKSCESLGGRFELRRAGMFSVASRYPITDWQWRPLFRPADYEELGLGRRLPAWLVRLYNAAAEDSGAATRAFDERDYGAVTFLRIDTTGALGRPIVVWFVDLPSNPLVSRMNMARLARSRLDALARELVTEGAPGDRFPLEPDLIIGDLNTPRGAASVREMAPGFRNAAGAARPGRLASWPRVAPMWHIDQSLVGPRSRAVYYALIDPGESDHLVQVVDLSIGSADKPDSPMRSESPKETAELPSVPENQP